MRTLLAAGVPAGVAQRSSELLQDPQYAHRGFYRYFEHAEMGRIPYAGHAFRIRGYDTGPRTAAPLLGGTASWCSARSWACPRRRWRRCTGQGRSSSRPGLYPGVSEVAGTPGVDGRASYMVCTSAPRTRATRLVGGSGSS